MIDKEVSEKINPNLALWRYMDFTKFVDLIERKTLYFAPLNSMIDKYEGRGKNPAQGYAEILKKRKSESEYLYQQLEIVEKNLNEALEGIEEEEKNKILTEVANGAPDDLRNYVNNIIGVLEASQDGIKKHEQAIREQSHINCWNINDKDSLVMWNIYTPQQGIAIKTNFKRLINSLDKNTSIIVRKVEYVDNILEKILYDKPFSVVFTKREEFSYEKELRLLTLKEANQDKSGIHIPINLNKLIDEIYISPNSPAWLIESVKILLQNHKLSSKKVIANRFYEYIE